MSEQRTKHDIKYIFNRVLDDSRRALQVLMQGDVAIAIDASEDTISSKSMHKQLTIVPGDTIDVDIRGYKTMATDGSLDVQVSNDSSKFVSTTADLIMTFAYLRLTNSGSEPVSLNIEA